MSAPFRRRGLAGVRREGVRHTLRHDAIKLANANSLGVLGIGLRESITVTSPSLVVLDDSESNFSRRKSLSHSPSLHCGCGDWFRLAHLRPRRRPFATPRRSTEPLFACGRAGNRGVFRGGRPWPCAFLIRRTTLLSAMNTQQGCLGSERSDRRVAAEGSANLCPRTDDSLVCLLRFIRVPLNVEES